MGTALFRGGPRVLFLGVETYDWNDAQFTAAGQFARSHGFTGVALKVADGGNVWYGGYSGIAAKIALLEKTGVQCILYTYAYAAYVAAETAVLAELLRRFGGAICDMEVEFNGQVAAAQQFEAAMRPIAGVLYVTTWADPVQQDWVNVINALAPAVNGWIPQEYNNFLEQTANVQFGAGLQIYPAIDITQEFGANNPVQIAKDAAARQDGAIFVWEYQPCTQNPTLTSQVTAAFGAPTGGTTKPVATNTHQEQAMLDTWHASHVPQNELNYNSGIANAWREKYRAGKQYGPPYGPEYHTVDWGGTPIIAQDFLGARCEWKNGNAAWIER